jgi:hypothetical protein
MIGLFIIGLLFLGPGQAFRVARIRGCGRGRGFALSGELGGDIVIRGPQGKP